MTDDRFEEIQADAEDLNDSLDDALGHLSNVTSCETIDDLRGNLWSLRYKLRESLAEVDKLYKLAILYKLIGQGDKNE